MALRGGEQALAIHAQAFVAQQVELARQHNRIVEEMEVTSGVPRGTLGRYSMPQPVVHTGNVNNIRVDRSVVGAINTGTVQRLDVALKYIHNAGGHELATQLLGLTKAVVGSSDLTAQLKVEAVEHLSYLATQAALPVQQQERSVVRLVLNALGPMLSTAADIATLWGPVSGMLARVFGGHGQ